jgi:non-specific serine/threonine protein kinase/serine/threonine-protein kinase
MVVSSAEAQVIYRHALTIQRRVLGPGHPDTLMSMQGLGGTYIMQGNYKLAAEILREALGVLKFEILCS